MNNPAKAIELSDEDRVVLRSWVRAQSTPQQVARRATIILQASEGVANSHIAQEAGVSRTTVVEWRKRFLSEGVKALTRTRPGRGRKPRIEAERIQKIVEATLHSLPPGATHWSCRSMAKAQGVSPSTVHRIWGAHGLQPHRVKDFKLSRDQKCVEKLTDTAHVV